MEQLLFILLIGFLFWITKKIRGGESMNIPSVVPVKVHKNGHGHRCYIEGLNHSERRIVRLLANNLDHNEYFIFNNIILPSKVTETTQIDHIVVSKYGVFIIETKEYSGWIFVHPNRKEWTQTFSRGSKFPMNNPIWQNYGHVLAMKEQLSFLGNRFFNVVVFSGDCKLKNDKPENVLYEEELVDFIKSKKEVKLKEVELLVVIGKLSMLCQVTDITEDEHVQNLRNTFEKLNLKEDDQTVGV